MEDFVVLSILDL
jgi:hypothetical protein